MARGKRSKDTNQKDQSYLDRLNVEVAGNQSKLSMFLGILIILVLGVLIFNYFSKNQESLGPAQQTQMEEQGQYTVREGDTLFLISQKYYNDGFKFNEIAKANNLSSVDSIEVGQVLRIPKLSEESATATEPGTGGGNATMWGPNIDGDTYIVEEGDWLSTISARAYNDIFAYSKIAQANNITNPDLIYPGQVLKIPR